MSRAIRVTYYIRVQWPNGRWKDIEGVVDIGNAVPGGDLDNILRHNAYSIVTSGEKPGATITDFRIVSQVEL